MQGHAKANEVMPSMTRAGLEPATYGLTYHFGFRRPRCSSSSIAVRGLDCPFAFTTRDVVIRHPPSSLYTFRRSGLARGWQPSVPRLWRDSRAPFL